jgi:hypothetical protein
LLKKAGFSIVEKERTWNCPFIAPSIHHEWSGAWCCWKKSNSREGERVRQRKAISGANHSFKCALLRNWCFRLSELFFSVTSVALCGSIINIEFSWPIFTAHNP